MLELLKLFEIMGSQQASCGQPVSFSVPMDHPAAKPLEKLFIKLSTSAIFSGGQKMLYGPEDENAVQEFLEALKDVVESTGEDFDSKMAEFAQEQNQDVREFVRQSLSPEHVGRLLLGVLGNPMTREMLEPKLREKFGNFAEEKTRG